MPASQGHLPRAVARTAHLRPHSDSPGRPQRAFPSAIRQTLPSPPRSDRLALAALPPRLPCWRGDRPSRGASRARLPEGWRLPGVYSCPSAAAGLSRVLGRRSAPGSGSNCEPGVRQPSSRDSGPGAGALRRPGTRAAEGSPVASGGRAPSENPSVGPAGDV